jgi:hypothetical protein
MTLDKRYDVSVIIPVSKGWLCCSYLRVITSSTVQFNRSLAKSGLEGEAMTFGGDRMDEMMIDTAAAKNSMTGRWQEKRAGGFGGLI